MGADKPIVVVNKGGGAGNEGFVYGSSEQTNPHRVTFGTNNEYLLPLVAKMGYSAAKPEPAAKSSKLPVTRVIPAVQQAVDTHADEQGWARLSDVSKQLAAQGTDPQQYGFETINHLIHAIYTDWLEIKKAGRGERLRVNKRFTAKG